MTKPNDGGPAFPRPASEVREEMPDQSLVPSQPGMSLRDWFAGQALKGLCSDPEKVAAAAAKIGMKGNNFAVNLAWTLADLMLDARQPK